MNFQTDDGGSSALSDIWSSCCPWLHHCSSVCDWPGISSFPGLTQEIWDAVHTFCSATSRPCWKPSAFPPFPLMLACCFCTPVLQTTLLGWVVCAFTIRGKLIVNTTPLKPQESAVNGSVPGVFGSSSPEAASLSSIIRSNNLDQLVNGIDGRRAVETRTRVGSDLLCTSLCQGHLLRADTPGIPVLLLCPVNMAAELLLQCMSRSGETGRSKENHRQAECWKRPLVSQLSSPANMPLNAVHSSFFHPDLRVSTLF